MIKIAHRINTIKDLKKIPKEWGVEIDVRHNTKNDKIYLNHDPGKGEDLEKYLKNFKHAFIIFNIKEAGIEQRCINLAKKYNVPKSKYFLLDVEFPYLYRASRKEGVKEIAVRFSETEPIEMTLKQRGFVNWVWIDTNTKLPLDKKVVKKLKGFRTCLVSPDRWHRPKDIATYRKKMEKLNFHPDAIMIGFEYAHLWR